MAYEDVPFLVASDALMELSSPSPPFFCFSEDQSCDSPLFPNLPMSHQDPTSITASLDKFNTAASKSINQSNGDGDDELQKTQNMAAKRKQPNSEDGSFPDTATIKKQKKKSIISSSDQQPPKGYIHVRARRGEATDSHSLAERVRREKISERMRFLQALVPGCDKLTGKATVLDEIINYVLSLQTQVEVLTMKLSSLSPMVYNFDVDLEALMLAHQGLNMISSAQMGTGTNNAAWTAQQATTAPTARVNLSLIEAPNFFHQQQRQIWTNPPFLQGNTSRSLYML